MKTVGLDTSVVLRLLLGVPVDQAARAEAFLDEVARSGSRAVVSDLVVADSYFALQHHYGVPKSEAQAALRRMFAAGEIEASGSAGKVLSLPGLSSAKPGLVDRLIHGAYTSGEGTMVTFEKAAGKLGAVRVL